MFLVFICINFPLQCYWLSLPGLSGILHILALLPQCVFFYQQQTSSTWCSFPFPCLTWVCQTTKVWAWVSAELHWWLPFAPRRYDLLLSLPCSYFSTISQPSLSPTFPPTSVCLVALRKPLVFGKGLGWSPFGNSDRSEGMRVHCPCLAPLKNSERFVRQGFSLYKLYWLFSSRLFIQVTKFSPFIASSSWVNY